MIRTTENGRFYRVTGDKPHLIDEDRNAAVEFAQHQATEDRKHSGLVTRHGPASFTVAASSDVRYGITQEREHS